MPRNYKLIGFQGSTEDLKVLFSANGHDVQLEEDDWMPVSQVMHETYDFNKKATEYSNKSPPDVVQFSEKAWGAAAICINEFYLKRFGILIKSHSAKSKLLSVICAGLNGTQSSEVALTWINAEISQSDFHDMNFVAKNDREAFLESLKEMPAIIEQTDLNVVSAELKSLKSVTFKNIQKSAYKIGNNSYDFNCVAY